MTYLCGRSPRPRRHWDRHGYAILPAFLSEDDLRPGLSELGLLSECDAVPRRSDPARNAAIRDDEYGGLVTFPFASVELCLLAVLPPRVARGLLRTSAVRIYSPRRGRSSPAPRVRAGAPCDFVNHTVVVPSDEPAHRHVELFIWSEHDSDSAEDIGSDGRQSVPCDMHRRRPGHHCRGGRRRPTPASAAMPELAAPVSESASEDLGPTHLVPIDETRDLSLLPHEILPADHPRLYECEVSAAGPQHRRGLPGVTPVHRATARPRPDARATCPASGPRRPRWRRAPGLG